MYLLHTLLFIISRFFVVTSNSCSSDRNKDHRPRVTCVSQSLHAVPDGIDLTTQVLVFTQNQFRSLSWADYSSFTHLHELDLSENHISVIDPPGQVLGSLRVLRLSNNRLEGLGGRVFTSVPNLMEVYLDGNSLRSLHDATFSELPHLEVISLSRNLLPALPPRLLERISSTSLKTFDLEANRVQIMPDGFFSSKPELPYVFLSQNLWRCNCEVMYLQLYLEDQSHNVYQRKGRTALENNPESVVCAWPPHLKDLPIINLEKEQYCSTDTPINTPSNTLMASPIPIYTTTGTPVATASNTPTANTLTDVDTGHLRNFPVGDMDVWNTDYVTHSTTPKSTPTSPTTTNAPFSVSTLPYSTLPYTLSYLWTRIESWTIKHTWFEELTFKWNSSLLMNPQHHPTASTDRQRSSSTPYAHTAGLGSSFPATSSTPTASAPVRLSPGAFGSGASRSKQLGQWCWWMIAVLWPLCFLSILCCCMLFVWLFLTYRALYRPLWEQAQHAVLSGAVTLQAYRAMGGAGAMGGVGGDRLPKKVEFLHPEKIREMQVVFRSVLFISKEVEDHEKREEGGEDHGRRDTVKYQDTGKPRGSDVTAKTELETVAEEDKLGATLQSDRERDRQRERGRDRGRDRENEVIDRKEVFKMTMYRLINGEDETEGRMDMQESCGWAGGEETRGGAEKGKTRYSLILREERGSVVEDRKGQMEWLVGGWEMDGGINQDRWGSL